MNWKWVKDVVDAAVNLVDKAFPVFVGQRTKIATVACPILAVAAPFVVGVVPAAAPVVPVIQGVLCSAAPVFAAAGLLRK